MLNDIIWTVRCKVCKTFFDRGVLWSGSPTHLLLEVGQGAWLGALPNYPPKKFDFTISIFSSFLLFTAVCDPETGPGNITTGETKSTSS